MSYDGNKVREALGSNPLKLRYTPGDEVTAQWYAQWTPEDGHKRMVTKGIILQPANNEGDYITDMGEHGIVIINQMNVLTPANTCWKCKTGIVESTEDTRTMRVGKHTVQVTAPSWTCRSCGEVVYLAIDMMIIEHNLAKKLVQGPPDAKVFSFCRKVMGMNRWRVTLAFEVSEAVVRSWEDGSMEIPKDQWKHLQDLVLNHQVI